MVVVTDTDDEDDEDDEDDDDAFGRVVVVTTRAAVVGGETASKETSVSRSRTSSLNCTSSARRVSNSSSLLSKSPQPAPTSASTNTSARTDLRVCMEGSIPDVGADDESPTLSVGAPLRDYPEGRRNTSMRWSGSRRAAAASLSARSVR